MNATLKSSPDQYDVILCGGGPVGLSLAYLLGRAGLQVALFERRASTTTLPKGQYLHASTGELFRQWGVWDLLHKAGWETERSNGQGFYVNVATGPVAQIRATEGTHADYVRKWSAYSPVYPRKIPAADYEAAIRRQASAWPTTALHFNSQVVDVTHQDNGVRVTVRDTETQATKVVGSRYLVACDGAHSFIRSRIGQGQDHGPTFGNQVLLEFRAELADTLGRDGFFHSFILDPRYAGWFGSQHPDTGLWRYSFRHDEDTLPPPEVLIARLRGALGMPALPVELVQTYRFDYSTGLLRRWREGPVFFAGDAAHWHSPWGGFGMNSGVQDAANLGWKLALVCQGVATEALLDTYEVERRSKALLTVKSATYNSLHYQAIAEAVRVAEGPQMARGTLSPQGVTFLTQRVVPHGDNSVLHTGYQLGTVYQSNAVVANEDPVPMPELCDYTESTAAGVRAPHAWLADATGRRLSTIDLWAQGFVLIGHRVARHWAPAVQSVAVGTGLAVHLADVHEDGPCRPYDAKFAALYGRERGAVFLVRPDGFIAAKLHADSEAVATQALTRVLRQVLGHEAPRQPQPGALASAV